MDAFFAFQQVAVLLRKGQLQNIILSYYINNLLL